MNVIEKHVEDCIQVNNDDEEETKRIDAAELMQQKRRVRTRALSEANCGLLIYGGY